MRDNNKYHQLDEIGFIGVQEPKSPASKKYHDNKTAQVFRAAKVTRSTSLKRGMKKG